MTLLRLVAATTLLVVLSDADAQAFLPRDQVELGVAIVTNSVDGARSACEAWVELQSSWKQGSTVAIGEVRPRAGSNPGSESRDEWEGVGSRTRCLGESAGGFPVDSSEGSGHPLLVGEVSTSARLNRKMEDEKVLVVKLSVSLRRLTGFGVGDAPVYESSVVEREMFFPEAAEVFVPILIAGDRERQALGIHEAFVRIRVRNVTNPGGVAYGTVSVTSDLEDADLFMDGGPIGRIGEGSLTLEHVSAGEHEFTARDAAGAELRRAVNVVADRTSLVRLAPPDAERAAHYRLEPLGKNPQGYETYRRGSDGVVVVQIPAGEFLMGNHQTERTPFEHPVHVSEFLMDETGVTWGQFKVFAEASGIPLPLHNPYWGVLDDHPMIYVTWEEARSYCSWAGGRLPTEAEREKGARGTDERKYPWGDEAPDPERAVFRRSWGKEATSAVGTHPAGASPYGLQDMGGNVWEWCADWYDGDYYESSPHRDPKGPPMGNAHVVRGGSWDSRPDVLSSSCRSWGHRGYRDGDFGFRCAMDAPR